MNKTLIVVLLGLACISAATSGEKSNFQIDDASSVLHQLLESAVENLASLRSAWEQKKPLLESAISQLEELLSKKQEQCADLDDVLAKREQELKDAQDYVAWLSKRIEENQDRIKQILDDRCAQNGNYIEGLKHDKLALKLLQFLRTQIANKESFSLAQRKTFRKSLHNFLSVYKTGNYAQLVLLEKQFANAEDYAVETNQDVHDRSSEQIGSGHVDNNEAEIDVENFNNGQRKGWVQIKEELLELLSNLEQSIQKKMAQAQEDEVNASTAAADYKIQLEHEIEVYQKDLAKWQQVVVQLIDLVAQDTENVAQCRREEASISQQLNDARQQLVDETNEFEHRQSGFEEEVQVFQEVVALYDETTANQGDDFKARADDYIDDGHFDEASYNDREVPDIQLLNN